MNIDWLKIPAKPLNKTRLQQALQHQNQLTKPPGSLGQLETLATQLAAMQDTLYPSLDHINITVFASDHGVVIEGVSAYPQSVTLEMVRNFSRGGAAICVLAKQLNATLEVVNVGTLEDPGSLEGVINQRINRGTANFCEQPAMTANELSEALAAGQEAVERARKINGQLFIGGEMGIGNTTATAAMACALLKKPASLLVGPGTGLDTAGVENKARVIQRALLQHENHLQTPLAILRHLGGFEIAALTGAYISCAQQGLPILVDGFISSVAALIAIQTLDGVASWMFFAHTSAEPGHTQILAALDKTPLLNLDMRLGEGSGAAVAVPLLRLACALHANMATFAQANISDKKS